MIPKLIIDKKQNGLPNPDFTKFLKTVVPRTSFTKESSDELYKILSESIDKYGGVGISANQLGIMKRACLIKIDNNELFLLNPQISYRDEEGFIFYEGCLSIVNSIKKPVRTIRAVSIKVTTDNFGELEFKINPDKDKDSVSLETMQTVVVQHEIDHLDGKTIRDCQFVDKIKKSIKYGRNDKVIMKSPEGEIVEVKHKKANQYFLKGYEII